MTPFERALAALDRLLGSGSAELILRTELRDDASLFLTTEHAAGERWFAWRENALQELLPVDETRLPAAPELVRLCSAGHASLLSWRPGRRMVVRRFRGEHARIVKAHRPGRASDCSARHRAFAVAAAAGIRTATLLDEPDLPECAVHEFLPGEALSLRDAGVFTTMGGLLARLQRGRAEPALPMHERSAELRGLDRLAARYTAACGRLPAGWAEVRAALAQPGELGVSRVVIAHRDLHDGQFVVQHDSVAVIDLDLASRAEPELDLANLAVHLTLCGWLRLRGADQDRARAAVRCLYAGHGALEEPAERFYTATTALRLALVHGVRPRARSAIAPLVDLAGEAASHACLR